MLSFCLNLRAKLLKKRERKDKGQRFFVNLQEIRIQIPHFIEASQQLLTGISIQIIHESITESFFQGYHSHHRRHFISQVPQQDRHVDDDDHRGTIPDLGSHLHRHLL
jgi:hypothetical protein